ncbi:hypothetical protein DFQ29_003146 [Apophysomyces sp. BC1021]|nr:hypothetical protein DFQ29_003146 [Apophysomyces sp. BC1021]
MNFNVFVAMDIKQYIKDSYSTFKLNHFFDTLGYSAEDRSKAEKLLMAQINELLQEDVEDKNLLDWIFQFSRDNFAIFRTVPMTKYWRSREIEFAISQVERKATEAAVKTAVAQQVEIHEAMESLAQQKRKISTKEIAVNLKVL